MYDLYLINLLYIKNLKLLDLTHCYAAQPSTQSRRSIIISAEMHFNRVESPVSRPTAVAYQSRDTIYCTTEYEHFEFESVFNKWINLKIRTSRVYRYCEHAQSRMIRKRRTRTWQSRGFFFTSDECGTLSSFFLSAH